MILQKKVLILLKSQETISDVYFKVSLVKKGTSYRCGGTIYSETLIVTSGKCCHFIHGDLFKTSYEVTAGDLIRSSDKDWNWIDSGLEQRSNIKDYLIHPDYEVGHLNSQLS